MEMYRDGVDPCVVSIRGRFDANECDEFGAFVDGLKAEGHLDLALDLSLVDFIDSSALASLVQLSKAATKTDNLFEVRNPSDPVRVILEITAVDRALTIRNVPAASS